MRAGFWLHLAVWLLAFTLLSARAVAQVTAPPPQGMPGVPVVLDKHTLFRVYEDIGHYTAKARAGTIRARLARLADDPSFRPENLSAEELGNATYILAGQEPIMVLPEGDARAAGRPRQALAAEYIQTIQQAITKYREARSAPNIAKGALYSLLVTLGLLLLLRLLGSAYAWAAREIEAWSDRIAAALQPSSARLLSHAQFAALLLPLLRLIRFAVLLMLLYLYLAIVLSLFPWTQGYEAIELRYVEERLHAAGSAFVAKLPDLLFIGIIIVITHYIIRGIRLFFAEVGRGAISLPGFESEWAIATYKLLRLAVIAMAVVAAFPYVPGSNSDAFKGITLFLGAILSLGSTGAISNMVSGVVLTYMRPFHIGDRVQIADTTGDVIEKSLLVTRVRTIKNEEITIPNSMILNAHIVNYSALARGGGLILHTTVNIGYDTPWRQVHELLVAAARATEYILTEPAPFVLQTSLDDYYVSYELNAYTDQPGLMANLYGVLHQNIQDRFNEAGVEIMSPHYTSLRDGNRTTIPAEYLPQDYKAPPFRAFQRNNAPGSGRSKTAEEGDQ
jgi:small-conductance mechanosensitive channel